MEADSCRDGVPEYYKKMLSDLYKTERKDPLDGVIARYNDKRATLNQLMDTCDCEYSNIIRMIGINPNR